MDIIVFESQCKKCRLRKFWVQTKFGSSQNKWPKIFFGSKKCLVNETFGKRKDFGFKKVGLKQFLLKIFWVQ